MDETSIPLISERRGGGEGFFDGGGGLGELGADEFQARRADAVLDAIEAQLRFWRWPTGRQSLATATRPCGISRSAQV